MAMRTHELHPSLVHVPLVLLPATAAVDLLAALAPRDRRLDRLARSLWWATAASGLVTGLAGMAASQEISLEGEHARDMMFIHGAGNVGLVLAALGVATWRSRHRATLTSAAAGLAASGAAVYTAYLGGELVYTHGAGVVTLGRAAAEAPALFSRAAPGRLAGDAVRGLGWLARRAAQALTGRRRVERSALGPIGDVGGAATTTAEATRH
ncbi:MAG: DUF2231 domain-containing protein [Anaeromyxobacter sp.]